MDKLSVLPQNEESPVRLLTRPNWSYRIAYRRSIDSIQSDDNGQDFLGWVDSGNSIAVVLCDGVSQSFFGDLGAKMLGSRLLEWLIEIPQEKRRGDIQSSLVSILGKLQQTATDRIDRQSISSDLPIMVRQVLEEKRKHGTESMFIGMRIDLPSSAYPEGRLLITWMGDSRIRLWEAGNERTSILGVVSDTNQRWSSKQGLSGKSPNLYLQPLVDKQNHFLINSIQLYSDGLSKLDRYTEPISNFALQDLIDQTGRSASSDDVSIFELWIGKPPENINEEALAQVTHLKYQCVGDRISASWDSLATASSYEIELFESVAEYYHSVSPRWSMAGLSNGKYQMRVRGVGARGVPGSWSEPAIFTIQREPSTQKKPIERKITSSPEKQPKRNRIIPAVIGIGLFLMALIGITGAFVLRNWKVVNNRNALATQMVATTLQEFNLKETSQAVASLTASAASVGTAPTGEQIATLPTREAGTINLDKYPYFKNGGSDPSLPKEPNEIPFSSWQISRDDRYLALVHESTIEIIQLDTQTIISTITTPLPIIAFSFSDINDMIYIYDGGTVSQFAVQDGMRLTEMDVSSLISGEQIVAISGKGDFATVSSNQDTTDEIWVCRYPSCSNLETKLKDTISGSKHIREIYFSLDGNTLIGIGEQNIILIWRYEYNAWSEIISEPSSIAEVRDIKLIADDQDALLFGPDESFEIRNTDDGSLKASSNFILQNILGYGTISPSNFSYLNNGSLVSWDISSNAAPDSYNLVSLDGVIFDKAMIMNRSSTIFVADQAGHIYKGIIPLMQKQ